MTTQKHKAFADMAGAFRAGKMPEGAVYLLDNDCSYVYHPVTGEILFEGHGKAADLEGALDALNIPWEHA